MKRVGLLESSHSHAETDMRQASCYRITRLSFVLRWLAMVAIYSVGHIAVRIAVAALHKHPAFIWLIYAGLFCAVFAFGVAYWFFKHALVPRLQDIGFYAPFLWIVVAVIGMLVIFSKSYWTDLLWLGLAVTPGNFIPSEGSAFNQPHQSVEKREEGRP